MEEDNEVEDERETERIKYIAVMKKSGDGDDSEDEDTVSSFFLRMITRLTAYGRSPRL
jgi:hypothetical protein